MQFLVYHGTPHCIGHLPFVPIIAPDIVPIISYASIVFKAHLNLGLTGDEVFPLMVSFLDVEGCISLIGSWLEVDVSGIFEDTAVEVHPTVVDCIEIMLLFFWGDIFRFWIDTKSLSFFTFIFRDWCGSI